MREIEAKEVTKTVASLIIEAAYTLPDDVLKALQKAREIEESTVGREILDSILENAEIGNRGEVPLCQDTGDGLVFLELGQDVHIVGGDLFEAVNEGVRIAYDKGYLRKSMVRQPFSARINTGDNTPVILHTHIVPGDKLRIIAAPKGGGGENPSRFCVMLPAAGRQGIIDFAVETVDAAGPNACPPVIVGVGIGGTVEMPLLMAKRALFRRIGEPNPDDEIARLEKDILEEVNKLGIGPQGLGGTVTALAVHVEVYPCHIASLPVAVNLQCHSARYREAIL